MTRRRPVNTTRRSCSPSGTATTTPAGPVVYRDALLRVSVVVEHGGGWWLCPRQAGGWTRRTRLRMTDDARRERLRPEPGVSPEWLGIPADNEPQDCARMHGGAAG